MNHISTGLRADNFGEWLASLGLLRVAATIDPDSALAFSDSGEATLTTNARESEIAKALLSSAAPDSIRVEYLKKISAPDSDSVRVGDQFFQTSSHLLSLANKAKEFDQSEDSKKGCPVELLGLGGLRVRHFIGAARSEEAGLESPLILWAGMVAFQGILRATCGNVASMSPGPLPEMFGIGGRQTQRFRFDHANEQFVDDGAHDSSAGRHSRSLVEWGAFVGLSFFPAGAGFETLSPMRRHVASRIWKQPLDSQSTLLALHSGQARIRRFFFAAPDGKMKKLRPITPPDQSHNHTKKP